MKDLVASIMKEKERKNLRPDSLRTLSWNFTNLEQHFGSETLVKAITRADVESWVQDLQSAGHKSRNLRNYVRYAKQFL